MLNFRWDVFILAFVKKRKKRKHFQCRPTTFSPFLFKPHVALSAIKVHEMTLERYNTLSVYFFFYNCVYVECWSDEGVVSVRELDRFRHTPSPNIKNIRITFNLCTDCDALL